MQVRGWLLTMMVVGLCACTGSEEPEEAPMPVEESVFGDMTQTMDKAKAVEATTMERKEELDRALDAQ